ncbi:unnamed protein product [Brassica oleracea var. botrytis]
MKFRAQVSNPLCSDSSGWRLKQQVYYRAISVDD